jgi:hypothetical protein
VLIKMLRARRFANAGQEIPLDVGEVVDLPVVVALSLVATGAAVKHEDTPEGGAKDTAK